MPRRMLALVALLAGLALAGCAGHDAAAEPDAADRAFVVALGPYHENALAMVDLARARTLSPGLADLVDDIASDQAAQLATLDELVAAWKLEDADVTTPGDDLGIVGAADLAALETASADEFEAWWLALMTQHHEAVVAVAREELATGSSPAARALARRVIEIQEAQIGQMDGLLEP